ncbi:MAG: glycosyl transferase [Bacteroidales bacterium]|nr:glycosyl transferase [Bacteroidales bacterium]
MTVIPLDVFEDEELLQVKPVRTRSEYCWTCTSSTILYILNHYNVEHCTYLDADLYFFSPPQPLIDEMGNDSILITSHRYTPKYDQSRKTGIYCVQFVTFRNDMRGLTALHWWRNACLEWCYNRFEDGKFGDQKYLDDWTERFDGVHVLAHLGGGVAPWNMQQYSFEQINGKLTGLELNSGKQFDVVFFHFHSLMFVAPHYFSPRPYYRRNDSVISLLFKPYVNKIQSIRKQYVQIEKDERYLHGWDFCKYIAETFIRRGFREIHYIKILHQ